MKYFYKLLAAAILFPLFSVAQSNYKPAYVVTAKGDTLRGFIDYREWDSNPNVISFKGVITESKARKFTAKDIAFFNINDLESYQTYRGAISTDFTGVNRINNGKNSDFRIDTVFLKLLQKGQNAALYSYEDEIKTRFYVGEAPGFVPIELGYKVYNDIDAASPTYGKTITENTYLKQLFALANKYNAMDDDLTEKFRSSSYDKSDLLKIVTRINNISPALRKKQPGLNNGINLFAGLALSVTSIETGGIYRKWGGKPATSLFPAISAGFDVPLHPNTAKLLFGLDLTISGHQYKSIYIFTGSPYVPVRYSYNQLSVAVEPQVIYNFYNGGSFKAFAGVGLAVTFYKYYNATYDLDYAATKISNAPLNFPGFFNTLSPLLSVKAGVNFNKRVELFVDYYSRTSVSKDYYFTLNSQVVQTGVHYFF